MTKPMTEFDLKLLDLSSFELISRIFELEKLTSAKACLVSKLETRIKELENFVAFSANTFSQQRAFVKMANELLARGL